MDDRPMNMKLPFDIDRNGAEPLTSQVEHGIVRGIETGFWKPGDILPTLDEFAAATGVSMIVVRNAIRRLVDAGRINPRPGVGTVVLNSSTRLWRGHVVIVDFETRSNFFYSRVSGILRERLIRANYLPSVVSVAAEEYDMEPLNAILRQPVSLAVVLGSGHGHDTSTVKRIMAAGVPVVTFSDRERPLPKVVGHMRLDESGAMDDFIQHCAKAGVRRMAHIRLKPPKEYGALGRWERMGIVLENWQIDPFDGIDPIENIQRGTMEFFETRLVRKDPDLPDVLYFDDDYAATAAIVSLLRHGVRIPEDVRLVASVRRGGSPPFPGSLACIEDDPFLCGEKMAELAIMFLASKSVPRITQLPLSYHPGATFPPGF
jgi:DNA-binding LacI/PurR family transcriptional regulator